MSYQIDIQNAALDGEPPDEQQIKHWVEVALSSHMQAAEVCIRIVDEAESKRLNAQYRNKDKPTNVLSFQYDLADEVQGEQRFLGDIVICAQVLEKEAKIQQKPLKAHWAHMVIHGLLHLIGYDHQNEHEGLAMEKEEISILKQLGYPNPYEEK